MAQYQVVIKDALTQEVIKKCSPLPSPVQALQLADKILERYYKNYQGQKRVIEAHFETKEAA